MSDVERRPEPPVTWWQKHPVTGLLGGWSVILVSLAVWTMVH
jgi:hypothetical protein